MIKTTLLWVKNQTNSPLLGCYPGNTHAQSPVFLLAHHLTLWTLDSVNMLPSLHTFSPWTCEGFFYFHFCLSLPSNKLRYMSSQMAGGLSVSLSLVSSHLKQCSRKAVKLVGWKLISPTHTVRKWEVSISISKACIVLHFPLQVAAHPVLQHLQKNAREAGACCTEYFLLQFLLDPHFMNLTGWSHCSTILPPGGYAALQHLHS